MQLVEGRQRQLHLKAFLLPLWLLFRLPMLLLLGRDWKPPILQSKYKLRKRTVIIIPRIEIPMRKILFLRRRPPS
jgi:hypothetical protein